MNRSRGYEIIREKKIISRRIWSKNDIQLELLRYFLDEWKAPFRPYSLKCSMKENPRKLQRQFRNCLLSVCILLSLCFIFWKRKDTRHVFFITCDSRIPLDVISITMCYLKIEKYTISNTALIAYYTRLHGYTMIRFNTSDICQNGCPGQENVHLSPHWYKVVGNYNAVDR